MSGSQNFWSVTRFKTEYPVCSKKNFQRSMVVSFSLCSKMYLAWDEETEKNKVSQKGLSKSSNVYSSDVFKDVLFGKIRTSAVNRGIRKFNNKMFCYSQQKHGLSAFYVKRKVCDDLISTKPLDI